jgi:hypothetical protein
MTKYYQKGAEQKQKGGFIYGMPALAKVLMGGK